MKRAIFGLSILACALTGLPASGAVVIDFGTGAAGNGGTVVVSGGNATGTNILIGQLNYQNGATNTTYAMTGDLNFNTSTNSISITGDIPSLGASGVSGTLLTGTFSNFTLTSFGSLLSVNGTGPDAKSANLLAALGLPTNQQFAFFGFSISGLNVGSTNTYTAISTDIANDAVPEPASIVLLGTVVFGITRVLRRRTAKA